MKKDFPSLKCKMPIKRKKGKALEGKDKTYNNKPGRYDESHRLSLDG